MPKDDISDALDWLEEGGQEASETDDVVTDDDTSEPEDWTP